MDHKKKLTRWYSPAQIKSYTVHLDYATMASKDGSIVHVDIGTATAIVEILEQARQLTVKVDHEIPQEMRKPLARPRRTKREKI